MGHKRSTSKWIESKGPRRFIRNLDQYIEVVYVLLWTLTLWAFFWGKLISEGPPSYFYHYTNWNWAINCIYYTGDLLTRLGGVKITRLMYLSTLFWLVYGSNWAVFFLVFIMFADNPGVLTDLAKQNGGKYSMGFLLNMNTVFHALPLIAVLIYSFLAKKEISNMVGTMLGKKANTGSITAFVLISFLLPIFTVGIYSLCVNFERVYGLTTSIGYIILVVIGVVVVFNGTTMLAFYSKSMRREYKLLKLQQLIKAKKQQEEEDEKEEERKRRRESDQTV